MTLCESSRELEWIHLTGNRVTSANNRIPRWCYLPVCSPSVLLGAASTHCLLWQSNYNSVWPPAPVAFGFFYLIAKLRCFRACSLCETKGIQKCIRKALASLFLSFFSPLEPIQMEHKQGEDKCKVLCHPESTRWRQLSWTGTLIIAWGMFLSLCSLLLNFSVHQHQHLWQGRFIFFAG